MTLEGKTAIITGATEGIGRATTELFAERGAQLVLVARRQGPGDQLVADLGPDRATFLAGDVSDPSTANRAIALALERFGSLSILVNNAAVDHSHPLLEVPVDEIRRVMDVNFLGALMMLQAAGRAMREKGGAIVNVTSRLAEVGVGTMGVYSATKGALLSLTRVAAIELAPFDIRVNAVAPGLTETPFIKDWLGQQDDPARFRADLADAIPQGRFADPKDIASAIAFLGSDEAAHITGASLPVDGGYTAQ